MEYPERLFKYLPLRFADAFVSRGDVLFRNLAYFRKIEDRGRSDLLEGLHMDYPDKPIMIQGVGNFVRWQGRAAFLNSIDAERLFVFCLSKRRDEALFEEFRADACVEILNPAEFIRRCRVAVARQVLMRDSGLLHGSTLYYQPNRAAPIDVTNPEQIPFCKHVAYAHQDEYRLAIPLKRSLKLTRRIINQEFSFAEEIAAATADERHIIVGSIADLACVHSLPPARREQRGEAAATSGPAVSALNRAGKAEQALAADA